MDQVQVSVLSQAGSGTHATTSTRFHIRYRGIGFAICHHGYTRTLRCRDSSTRPAAHSIPRCMHQTPVLATPTIPTHCPVSTFRFIPMRRHAVSTVRLLEPEARRAWPSRLERGPAGVALVDDAHRVAGARWRVAREHVDLRACMGDEVRDAVS